jgi:hypothetical protein
MGIVAAIPYDPARPVTPRRVWRRDPLAPMDDDDIDGGQRGTLGLTARSRPDSDQDDDDLDDAIRYVTDDDVANMKLLQKRNLESVVFVQCVLLWFLWFFCTNS